MLAAAEGERELFGGRFSLRRRANFRSRAARNFVVLGGIGGAEGRNSKDDDLDADFMQIQDNIRSRFGCKVKITYSMP